MKTIAFAGSNSSTSINHQLVLYASQFMENVEVIKLTDYDAPIYGVDIENENGIPSDIIALQEKLSSAGRLVISINEHNGNFSAYFKNMIDWLSRIDRTFLEGKELTLLVAAPGGGGTSVLNIAENMFPYFGAKINASFHLGKFHDYFKNGEIIDVSKRQELIKALSS